MCIKTRLIRQETFRVEWYLNSIENRGLFVARSRGPKKQSGGGRQAPEIGIRRIAKIFIQWN